MVCGIPECGKHVDHSCWQQSVDDAMRLQQIRLGLAGWLRSCQPPLRRIFGFPRSTLVVLVLSIVWAFNFLIVLPILQPNFIKIPPLAAKLASKLLLGAGGATTFRTHSGRAMNVRQRVGAAWTKCPLCG